MTVVGTENLGKISEKNNIEDNINQKQDISKNTLKLSSETNYSKSDTLFYEYFPLRLSLSFSKSIENLIIHDLIFRSFISEIERGLNDFLDDKRVIFENKIFIEEDWEIQNYDKLILSLNFKNIPFSLEMSFWKKINKLIYERINFLIKTSSHEKKIRLKELKKKFFIKIEM